MTVQEIQEIAFEKAVFGGYDMKSVDDFLEKVAEEFAALQKENASFKSKMKVLVDKIEEYRKVEDGMRRTLATAESFATETIDKAKAEAAQIVSSAKSETETKIATAHERLSAEEKKLETARQNTALFISRISAVYEAQMTALSDFGKKEALSNNKPVQPAPPTPPTTPAPVAAPSASVDDDDPVTAEVQAVQDVAKAIDSANDVKADAPVSEATRKFSVKDMKKNAEENFDFGELKFGSDYDPQDDK